MNSQRKDPKSTQAANSQPTFGQTSNTWVDKTPSCNTEARCTTPMASTSVIDLTSGKLLNQINPTPKLVPSAKKRAKSIATLLTSPEHIATVKERIAKKCKQTKTIHGKKYTRKRRRSSLTSSDEDNDDVEVQYDENSDTLEDIDETECTGCGEIYNSTKKKEDWLQGVICKRWFHENCSSLINTCQDCGKTEFKKKQNK